MSQINSAECEAAGLDEKEVKRIAAGISRYAKQAREFGIGVFGGSGRGTLTFRDGGEGKLILTYLDGYFDGGDGAERRDECGLLRGE